MNGEKWTWKDIFGVILIVGGSSIVVIFSGSNHPNYNVCVLLKLFRKTGTVIFLTFTCVSIFAIFCFIVVVEKNLAFKDASVDAIAETIETGELVSVRPNPQNAKPAAEKVQIRRRSANGAANNRANRISLVLLDQVAEDGSNLRTVTINSEGPENENQENDGSSDESSDDLTQDVGAGPSTRLSVAVNPLLLNNSSSSGQILDADGNHIQKLLNKKTEGGESIHTVSFTFKLFSTRTPQSGSVPIDLENSSPRYHSPEKLEYQNPAADPIVLTPNRNAKPPTPTSTWSKRLIEYSQKFLIIQKLSQIEIVPHFKHKIRLDSPYVRLGLPFSYASLGVSL